MTGEATRAEEVTPSLWATAIDWVWVRAEKIEETIDAVETAISSGSGRR